MKKVIFILMLVLSVVSFGEWKTGFFVDDFGDPTNEKYIYFVTDGSMDNSSVQNGNAKIQMFISSKGDVKIASHPYSWSNTPEKQPSTASLLKTDKGEVIKYFYLNNDGWMFNDVGTYNKLSDAGMINFLKKSKNIKIQINYKYGTSYTFLVDCIGFTKAYNQIL